MNYEDNYSDKSFFNKIAKYAKMAGTSVIYLALLLYYAAMQPGVPLKVRGTVLSALGYFILPLDAISDLIPAVGYSDDLGVLVFAIAVCFMYINEAVKEKAKERMIGIFGKDVIKDIDSIEKEYLTKK